MYPIGVACPHWQLHHFSIPWLSLRIFCCHKHHKLYSTTPSLIHHPAVNLFPAV
uniref:Uncharacterized protein n=1 Tax=Arundo donax TaxID=35708 RepID=A0A0A9T5P6_ARUDO